MVTKSDAARYAVEHSSMTKLLDSGKLQFLQTGMEFPATTPRSVLDAYAGGRAYKRALELRASEAYDFAQHEPYIVPHKRRDEKHFLFCRLTNSTLPRRKDTVIGHVNGKRFQRQLKLVQEKREESERIEQKRKERREKARGTKQKRGAEDMDRDKSKNGEEDGAEDILAGILSDEDQEMKDKDDEASVEDEDLGAGGDGDSHDDEKQSEENIPRSLLIDDEEEEGSVFWTRGRRHRLSTSASGDGKDTRQPTPPVRVPERRAKTRSQSSIGVPDLPTASEHKGKSKVRVRKDNQADSIAGKRTRREKTPKKTRRPPQRRKTSSVEA